jgi:hypothetical protein
VPAFSAVAGRSWPFVAVAGHSWPFSGGRSGDSLAKNAGTWQL